MNLGEIYEDRRGRQWRIIKIDGPDLYPVTAASWNAIKHYDTRCFQRDGRYFKDKDDPMDLVKKVRR